MTTYFPELKARSRWNASRRALVAPPRRPHGACSTSRSPPRGPTRGSPSARTSWPCCVRARDEDGRGLGDDDLRDELVALIAAGHETTAAAIAWGAVLLADDAAVRERAAQAAATATTATSTRWSRRSCGSARHCRAPRSRIARRAVRRSAATPSRAGTAHPRRRPWAAPRPGPVPRARRAATRALPRRSDAERYTWLPFGGGAHRCIGAALAELEIKVALSHDPAARRPRAGHARPGARGAPRPDDGPARGRARRGSSAWGAAGGRRRSRSGPPSDRPISGAPAAVSRRRAPEPGQRPVDRPVPSLPPDLAVRSLADDGRLGPDLRRAPSPPRAARRREHRGAILRGT